MKPDSESASSAIADLTIVALGASAGGLDALKGFFNAMPPDPRLAFVVVTHLAPQHASHMAELLGRASALPVSEARDGERVAAGRVYVIPPGCLMGIHAGALRLHRAAARPAIPRPIDHFMCELATEQGERCAGIVLSGADHDGTVGLKEIKAAGGLTMVQDPDTARFPNMPASAIAADVPDRVLPVERMGQALLDYLAHAPTDLLAEPAGPSTPGEDAPAGPPPFLQEIVALVLERTGLDFRWYRPVMLMRRLRRRMGLSALGDASKYMARLCESRDELDALVKDFLIGVTEFYRDPEAWQVLEEEVLPRLVADLASSEAGVRVWTAGCATGEESYSIAMALLEQLGAHPGDPRLTVLASDVDGAALAVARAGTYPEAISVTVPPARLARFFEKTGDRYLVRKALREAVLFAPQNLVRDPPFSRCDLIVCRNVLIYLEPAQQSRILELFHFALNPGGILFLGKSESLGSQAGLFEPVSREHRIFRRVGTAASLVRGFTGRWGGAGGFLTPAAKPPDAPSPAELARTHLGQRVVAAAVLVNRDGRALYFEGETGRYLQPAGEPAWDLPSLVREGLRTRLRAGLRQAVSAARAETLEAMMGRDGRFIRVAVGIEPLEDFEQSGLLLVCFDESPGAAPEPPDEPPRADAVLRALEEELASTRAHLLTAEREAEGATAELRIAHEEAMSMNEELQSSNEELETSKEELQALVEELSTVNSELEAKVAELERALNDLRNLMDSTRVATLFLDHELRIRRFTTETARLFHLIEADQGRRLRDITSRVADPELLAEAGAVLQRLEPVEKEVRTPEDQWFLRRILPYRTREEQVEGVVVTYTDITALRKAAEEARRLAAVLQDSNDAIIAYDFAGRIFLWSRGAQQVYGYDGEQAHGLDIARLVPDAQREAQRALTERLRQVGSAGPETICRIARDGRLLDMSVTASILRDESGVPYAVISTERDVTEQLRLEAETYFRAMADDIPALLRIDDVEGRAQFVNRAWLQFAGEADSNALLGQGWLKYVHPQDLEGFREAYRRARRQQRRFEGDLRLLQADGDYRWMRTFTVPRRDEAGTLVHYVNLALDIEERKRAELALAEAAVRKDQFLAMLAHELRNPLASIGTAATVIESCGPTDPQIMWATGVITRQIEQLARLVDDLMDTARVASGKITLTREPVELSVLVEQACESARPMIDARRQDFIVNVPAESLYVEGDLIRLVQIIGNLLTNASKYTPDGGSIQLDASASPAEIELAITDNGRGIAPHMLPQVFDMFIQADDTLDRSEGGLGIGLSLVEKLVHLHGGTVEAHSDGLGLGSQFRVRLPRLDLPQPDAHATPHDRNEAPGGALRVLVVDDNVDSAEGMAILLNVKGNHETRVAHDGASALSTALAFRPHAIVLDIGLPGMDGYEVARRLRRRRETGRVLLIALTGYGSPQDAMRVQAAGFDHHLVKPAASDQLLALLGQHRFLD